MRVPGWCTVCRRFRHVRVTPVGLVGVALGGIVHGECEECEEAAAARPKTLGGVPVEDIDAALAFRAARPS